MRIVILNHDWFASSLRDLGHEVVVAGAKSDCELVYKDALVDIKSVLDSGKLSGAPDLVLCLDSSSSIFFSGISELDCPIVYYSVDTHHHYELHADLAKGMDHTLVAQKDYVAHFSIGADRVTWFPLWAPKDVVQQSEKKYGACFVGTLDAKLNPERVKFFQELQELVPISICSGGWESYFPYSEIVINQSVRSDLNFRTFEAMASGAMLISDCNFNGIHDLFKSGEQIVLFERGNVRQAADLIKHYLSNKAEAKRIAQAGMEEVRAKHREIHRAERILDIVKNLTPYKRNHFGWGTNYIHRFVSVRRLDERASFLPLDVALKSFERGLLARNELCESMTCSLVIGCVKWEQYFHDGRGVRLLEQFHEVYPTESGVILALMRIYFNRGAETLARQIAVKLKPPENVDVFKTAEWYVVELLKRVDAPQIYPGDSRL